jgi:hypothetical protein
MQNDDQIQQQMFLMIASWQQSGIHQKAFCEQQGIRYHVFHYWYKKYRDAQLPAKENSFIPLQVKHPSSAAPITPAAGAHTEIVLPDGRRLLFHQPVSADYLKAIIS